jgi:hypothetical protein
LLNKSLSEINQALHVIISSSISFVGIIRQFFCQVELMIPRHYTSSPFQLTLLQKRHNDVLERRKQNCFKKYRCATAFMRASKPSSIQDSRSASIIPQQIFTGKRNKIPLICTKKLSRAENTFDCLKKKTKNSLFGKSKLPKKKQIQFISGSLIFLFKILFCECVDVWLFH